MKKFITNLIIKVSLFTLLLFLLVGGAVFFNYNHKEDYPAAIKTKYERLDSLKNIEKIIICGGSSSAYGINSTLIQESLNKPVVNTSLAMSLGSKFHLNITRDYLKKNDIVLYIPEYEFYYKNEDGDDFLYTTFFYYPKIFKDYNYAQKIKLRDKVIKLSIDYYIGHLKKIFKPSNTPSFQYNRLSYNYIGDNISLINNSDSKIRPEKTNRYQKLKSSRVSNEFVASLKKMNEECIKKGVKFLIAFPPIEESQFDERFLKDIEFVKKETNIKFIGAPLENIFKSNLFYDSSYHLNGNGRAIRTKELIKNIKKEI